ncbi:MAG TPA: L,D-transpeptidase family protein [Gammaproteobacteria bacterium]|nr:L,D-transpeptidase family protein [Gammaproteobacteria bacterium]
MTRSASRPEIRRRTVSAMAGAVLLICLVAVARPALALTFPLPPDDVDVVGHVKMVTVKGDETLLDIGRRNGLGYDEMHLANPGVDMWLPGKGTRVVVPTRFILPQAPRKGLVLNTAEMRIYYYPPPRKGQRRTVQTFPVSIGRQDWSTPLGETRIVDKIKNPAWYPPKSIKEQAKAEGRKVPDVVPPGPDNPLGQFKMRLGIPGYLIHGTNKPWGVGMRVSHGCIRMYPENIKHLFGEVSVNTPVRIVNQPVKAGWMAGELFIEVHPLLAEYRAKGVSPFTPAVEAIDAAMADGAGRVDHDLVQKAIRAHTGIPTPVSRDADTSAIVNRAGTRPAEGHDRG